MASSSSVPIVDLPIGIDGVCMICKVKPSVKEILLCALCATPWHSAHLLLSTLPQTDKSITSWECPDCDIPADGNERPQVIAINASTNDLLISIKEIETNPSLTDDQKAKQKQEVMGGKQQLEGDRDGDDCDDILELLGANFKCSFCMRHPERPVTETTGWKWMKPPPTSKKTPPASKRLPPVRNTFKETKVIKCSQNISLTKKLLNELCCEICNEVMQSPVTTPCAHNFCKACLLNSYTDLSFSMDRSCGGRTLRSKKAVNKCPICPTNITDFLENPQVNREMMVMIESLQKKSQEIGNTSADIETVSPADVETVSASDVETISMAIKKQKINEAGDVTIVGADGVAIVQADDAETVEEKKVGDIEVSEIISA